MAMPSGPQSAAILAVWAEMSWLDRLLPLWILAAMVLGVVLGWQVPEVGAPVA